MIKLDKRLVVSVSGLLVLLLSSCSTLTDIDSNATSAVDPAAFFHNEVFLATEIVVEEPEFFLSLPDNYKAELDRIMSSKTTEQERYRALRAWVYRHFENYEFDVTETYSIGELNTNRKINCLSFSAMFVAAARYVGVPADFQLVFAPPYWDAENDTWINNQHIDVTGEIRVVDADKLHRGDSLFFASPSPHILFNQSYSRIQNSNHFRYVVDINPAIVSIPLKRKILNDQQVLSLYYSNKSVEFLLDQDVANAYANAREALRIDPGSSGAWNNLAVLYSRAGELEYASAAFEMAIEMDESAYSARSNLAGVYARQGKLELASTMSASVEEFRRANPYYHQSLAEEMLNEGNYEQAIAHLGDAVERKHNELHFYHQLAIAHQKLGNDDAVVENLTSARRHARGENRTRFSGKLKAFQQLVEARLNDI